MKTQSRFGVTIPNGPAIKAEILHPVDLTFNGVGDERDIVIKISEVGGKPTTGILKFFLVLDSDVFSITYDNTKTIANNPIFGVGNASLTETFTLNEIGTTYHSLEYTPNLLPYGQHIFAFTVQALQAGAVGNVGVALDPSSVAGATVISPDFSQPYSVKVIAPDLVPGNFTIDSNEIAESGSIDMVMEVKNIGNVPTSGIVQFRVYKMGGTFSVGFNNALTDITVGAVTIPVTNTLWTFDSSNIIYNTITSNAPLIINPLEHVKVGITITSTSVATQINTLRQQITPSTGGGETPTGNNNKTLLLYTI